jgi:hypothetical protein
MLQEQLGAEESFIVEALKSFSMWSSTILQKVLFPKKPLIDMVDVSQVETLFLSHLYSNL